jgi:hypothetical protein
MPRILHVLFRRDPASDRQDDRVRYEGYRPLWPDGRPIGVGLDAFCTHGQRLFGLGRHLSGRGERLLELRCYPLADRDDDLTRLAGARVRRFYLERQGRQGRVHFLDGTPTSVVFHLDRDEPSVLAWVGLPALADGARAWFDLAALPPAEAGAACDRPDGALWGALRPGLPFRPF